MKLKSCPRCSTENPLPANFCRHCRYEFPSSTKEGTTLEPKILKFFTLETKYTYGSKIHIVWETENTNITTLNGDDVTSLSTMEYDVSKAETITLTAENDYSKSESSIRLSPRPLPKIISFSATPLQVQQGEIIKLKWNVQNGEKLVLISLDGEIDVSHTESIDIKSNNTTKYVLRCYSEDVKVYVEKEVVVEVILPVEINSFVADKEVIVESDKVSLKWDIVNATSITLYPLMKDISSLKQYIISPQRTSEYKIIATNGYSQKEMTLSIRVIPLPKVDVNFDKLLLIPRIHSVDVDYSMLFPNIRIKEVDVDRWMTMKPIEEIKSKTRKYAIITKIKSLYNKLTSL